MAGGAVRTLTASDYGERHHGYWGTTAANLTEYVERVVRTYEGEKTEGETFAEWAHRAEEDKLK